MAVLCSETALTLLTTQLKKRANLALAAIFIWNQVLTKVRCRPSIKPPIHNKKRHARRAGFRPPACRSLAGYHLSGRRLRLDSGHAQMAEAEFPGRIHCGDDLSLVQRFCQRVVVLAEGKLVEDLPVTAQMRFTHPAARTLQSILYPRHSPVGAGLLAMASAQLA